MKTNKAFKLPSGTIVPAGTELHFSNEGQGFYNGEAIDKNKIPAVALEGKNADYSETSFQMDKWMPDDPELMEEFYDIIDDKSMSEKNKVKEIKDFIENNSYEDQLSNCMPRGGTIQGLAEYLVKNK